jgi:hypothetical protein
MYNRGYVNRNRSNEPRYFGEEVDTLLADVATREGLTPWEESFIQSVRKGYVKYESLTEGQFNTLKKVAQRSCPEFKKEIEDWKESYTSEMHTDARIMAGYYKSNPPYFHDLASKVLADDDYILSKKAYAAMVQNKYAQRVLETARAEAIFPAGEIAVVRKGTNVPQRLKGYSGTMVIVLETLDTVANAAKGAKQCRIMPVGGTKPFLTEERWLKKLPKRLR